jgi:hypothetical protein
LLAGVAAEEFFVEFAPDPRHHHVFRRPDLVDGLGARREPAFELIGGEVQAVKPVDGVEVDRDRQELPVDLGQNAVLVRAPRGELRQMIEDLLRVCVENVRAVLVDEETRLVVSEAPATDAEANAKAEVEALKALSYVDASRSPGRPFALPSAESVGSRPADSAWRTISSRVR